MTVQVQAFPVRFAETVNRFGAARFERTDAAAGVGELVLVTLGGRSVMARIHGERVTRRGHQTLVSVHGRLTWVASGHVQSLADDAS
jgi:hypothetical protein